MTLRKIWGAACALLVCAGQARADIPVGPVKDAAITPTTFVVIGIVATALVGGGIFLISRLRRKPTE